MFIFLQESKHEPHALLLGLYPKQNVLKNDCLYVMASGVNRTDCGNCSTEL